MAYNKNNVSTAGKVTVAACLFALGLFALIFTYNVSERQFNRVEAQSTATTSVTVLNTPPQWTVDAQELIGSSTSTPTNSGMPVRWIATATDSNNEPYYLLICSTSATPTANSGAAPNCSAGVQWAVTASTTSGVQVVVGTTTTEAMSEANNWFAWVCDDNAITPRCNNTYKQGTGTTSSPFEVNHRPLFSVYIDDSPTLPGALVTFMSTSSDTDTSGSNDTVMLIVCNANDFATTTDSCGAGGMAASSTFTATNASASYTVVIPTQDQNYTAYGFVIDIHGHESTGVAQGTNSILTVDNAAPTTSTSTISLNGGSNMTLTVASGQTTGFTLAYTVADANSCVNAASTSEITNYIVSIYRSGVGSTSCDGTNSAHYDPNDCYPSVLATSTWNLSCTASSTSCFGSTDTTQVWNCTFPLWYIADPTDGTATSTQYSTEDWRATIRAIDDDGATSTAAEGGTPVDVVSFLAFALNTLSIPYGSLEPGQQTDPIVATTTMSATGNVGLDQLLSGESMCTNFQIGVDCTNSATSTISEDNQVYGTSTVAYASGVALSSTTATEIEQNVFKSTATSTQATGNTFWGIRVPGTITLAGSYTGQNTFTAVVGESVDWD